MTIVQRDLLATNGVIQGIGQVLVPASNLINRPLSPQDLLSTLLGALGSIRIPFLG